MRKVVGFAKICRKFFFIINEIGKTCYGFNSVYSTPTTWNHTPSALNDVNEIRTVVRHCKWYITTLENTYLSTLRVLFFFLR